MKFRKPKLKIETGKYYFVDFHDKTWESWMFYKGVVRVIGRGYHTNGYYIQRITEPIYCAGMYNEWLPANCFIKEVILKKYLKNL